MSSSMSMMVLALVNLIKNTTFQFSTVLQAHRCQFQLVSQSVSSTASGGDGELITEFLSSHFEI